MNGDTDSVRNDLENMEMDFDTLQRYKSRYGVRYLFYDMYMYLQS